MIRPDSTPAVKYHFYHKLGLVFGEADKPVTVLLKLLWRFPAPLSLPTPLLTPLDLYHDHNLLDGRHDGINVLRRIPAFFRRDTPTRSIYRMQEFLCAGDTNQLMLETHYFWSHPYTELWRLVDISDPEDDNIERYAVLACIVESLESAFRYRSTLGLQRAGLDTQSAQDRCPPWTSHVPSLSEPLILYEPDFPLPESGNPFAKRNISADAGNIFSI